MIDSIDAEYLLHTFDNGLRWVHRPIKSPIGHCGLIIHAGTRDELQGEHGLAHFVEHLLFKGTQKRKPYHILSRLDDVGGEINAYTSREETILHASFLKEYFARATDLIFDIATQSIYPEKEIQKEKEVVIDEINSYLDNPSEQLFDDFDEVVFPNQALGHSILGTEESVKSFTRKSIIDFTDRLYRPNNMVFVSVGDISHVRMQKIIAQYSVHLQKAETLPQRQAPTAYQATSRMVSKDNHQAHAIIGTRAYAITDPQYPTLALLNNLLGGSGLNNRLNLNIRERYGITYHLESFYNAYSDTGLFGVYLGTDFDTVERALKLVEKELRKLRELSLGSLQLHKAKKQLIGNLLLSQEQNLNTALSAGKSLLLFGKIESVESLSAKVEAITATQLQDVANELLHPDNLSRVVYLK